MSAHEAFDLGMGDWTDEPEETSVQPPPPKKRLRLSLGKEAPLRETTNRRFAGPVSTGELSLRTQPKGLFRRTPQLLLNGLSRILRAGHVAGHPLLPMRFRQTC